MKNRNLVLGSVASFALAGIVLAAPSIAQPLPRESTPAERAATEQLNAEQASEPGIVTVDQNDNAAGVAAYNAQVAEANAAAQAQYNSQLRDYQNKKQAYEQQNQNYQQQLGEYKDELANPPVVVEEHQVIVHDAPAVVTEEHIVPFPGRGLIDLRDIDNPDREIGGLPVADRAGIVVGHFRHMTHQDAGREKAVITLNNNKTVAVTDDHVRLDPSRNTVVADLTYDELNHMPARF